MSHKAIPKVLVRGLAKKVKSMINKFPVRKGGISTTISPEEIIEGKRKMDGNRKRINFGQYAEIYDGTSNTADARSVGGIAMYATNDREGFAFMCLDTGKSRHSNNWTVKPTTEDIITRVENIAKDVVDTEELMDELVVDELSEELDSAERKENILRAERRLQREEIIEQDRNLNRDDTERSRNIAEDTYEQLLRENEQSMVEQPDEPDNEQSISDHSSQSNDNESDVNQDDENIIDMETNEIETVSDGDTIESERNNNESENVTREDERYVANDNIDAEHRTIIGEELVDDIEKQPMTTEDQEEIQIIP